jgi:hypothetical protein
MKRKITKEEFKKVLDTIFPWGYSGDVEKWDKGEYFLGWCYLSEESKLSDVMSVNEDNGGVVFWLIHSDNVKSEVTAGVLEGMMHALLPDMVPDVSFDKDTHVTFFYFPEIKTEEV